MRRFGLILILTLTFAQSLAAKDNAALDPAKASFDALFRDWKAMLARMRTLQEKYQVAGISSRPGIEAEFNQLRDQGQKMVPKLIAAAEAAYKANPKADTALGDFLMAQVGDNLREENYEEAARLGKELIDDERLHKNLLPFYGFALYATDDFEGAKKYLTMAKEAGTLGKIPPRGKGEPHPDQMALGLANQEIARWEDEQKLRSAEAKADDLPRVKLTTTKGDITLELFENEAPNTVANFVNLTEKGFYNGKKFHRVIPGFMAQGGCPLGNGSGGPGYTIDCESVNENHRNHFRGSLSMAHAGPNTGGSQFFITFVPTPNLDGLHTVFGRVIDGMDVLAKIQRTQDAPAGPPDKIIKAEVLRKRDHEYVPKKNSE